MTFSCTLAADLLARDAVMYDALVLPNLTPEQVAEVDGIVSARATEAATAQVVKYLTPDTGADVAELFARDLLALADDVNALVILKSSESWTGRVVRVSLPGGGSLKVTVQAPKAPRVA